MHTCAPTLACIRRGVSVHFTAVSENTPRVLAEFIIKRLFCCLNAFINKTSDKYSVPRGEGRVASSIRVHELGSNRRRQAKDAHCTAQVWAHLGHALGDAPGPVAPLTWMQNFSFHLNALFPQTAPQLGKCSSRLCPHKGRCPPSSFAHGRPDSPGRRHPFSYATSCLTQ